MMPDYTFADAPPAQVVVVGAQRGAPTLRAWLQKRRSDAQVVMSVCTGAFKLADAGLLDGKKATTHHDFFEPFSKQFPSVTLVKEQRFVQCDDVMFTAGGLTSGIDLALHIVEKYMGRDGAEKIAKYMEYDGRRWMSPGSVSTKQEE